MSKRLLYLLGILLTAIIGAYLNWMFCCPPGGKATTKVPAVAPVVKPVTPSPTSYGLAFNDNSKFNYAVNDNFNFEGADFSILKPVSAKVDEGVLKLKDYLEANPSKVIDITGLFKSTEKNTSAYPNLGLARANAVKNYLVSKGISSKQINTFGKLDDSMIPNGTIYQGPVEFGFESMDLSDEGTKKAAEELEALHKEIMAHPLELHFATNSSNIRLTPEQRQEMADIAKYLDKVNDGKVLVVGHTDNTGDAAANMKLGLDRANTIKNYLVRNQILANKIESLSKGQNEPITTNATAEGRAKNRRVIVTLK
ncbi:OmpA family protein [Aquimarina agarilytica]|uniref:OmpA family protein n=1 Tax=Aquimarina agarilytica TaxID=1087449 RepID=UPI0002884173|nr:OmpA family protein [Aquimarina agarilytica]